MKRTGRLQSARKWPANHQSANVLRGYCKHLDVDWRCAAIELKALGARLNPTYRQQREIMERNMIEHHRKAWELHRNQEELEHCLLMAEITHGITFFSDLR